MNSTNSGIKKLYYSIGEVSDITGIKPYVLRYWQTEFKQLNPPKNRAGNRTYRQKDIDLILMIKTLLYEQKFTIDGARHKIESGGENLQESISGTDAIQTIPNNFISELKKELVEILKIIRE
ncbi:MAG: MerR family transcriptional regulator [Candidatus Marinimicrobia bacterium]|nr:MerR family transcriptional regulator [Candidatus Neomarinimicrobiota bacterium]